MTMRPCIVCGEPGNGPRCDQHAATAARGYGNRWRRLSEKARRLQPWCEDCGTTDDLTTDHTPEAWAALAAKGRVPLTAVAVVCRPCNTRRGAAR